MARFSSLILLIALVVVAVGPTSVQAQDGGMGGPDVIVTLNATPFANEAGLGDVTGYAHVVSDDGHIHIVLEPNGAALMGDSVLEGWVVDAGLAGGPGETNASDADEVYGVAFGDEAADAAVEAAPYALSTGVLESTMDDTWEVIFDIPDYNFSPYDAVVITLESDGNSLDGFDPRPGTPVFLGLIADGEPAGDMMMDDDEDMMDDDDMDGDDEMMDDDDMDGDDEMMDDDDMDGDDEMMDDDDMDGDDMMMEGTEVVLEPTPLAANAGLEGLTGTAQVYIEDAEIQIVINLNGAELPEGTVLEGWVVDAGLNGGPGETNASDADEVYGVAFGDEAADAAVEAAPYALSTGVAHDNMDGTLTLSFYVPGYNFSPYDAVVITLESDGNSFEGFDPRPGTPVLAGGISHEMME